MSGRQLKNPNFYLMLLADAVGIAGALILAYALRFDFFESVEYSVRYKTQLVHSFLFIIPLKLFVFFFFGLYRGMWRYTNLRDMRKIGMAVSSATLMIISWIAYQHHFMGFSRGIYLLDAIFSFAFAAGFRIVVREFFTLRVQGRIVNPFKWMGDEHVVRRSRTVVIGAGYCGEHLFRELSAEHLAPYEVLCYIDDDPKKLHRSLNGIRIFGGINRLGAAVKKFDAELILIAIAKTDSLGMRKIIEACERTGIPFKRIPTAGSIASGDVSFKELRDVNYEDLLSRPPVELNDPAIAECLGGETVLVTGAGGSIGSELVRQIVRFKPVCLVLVDSGEENLFKIQMELRNELAFASVVAVIARVQDEALMARVFSRHKPSVVFHAAAYKHVPLMEGNPWQAIDNNVIGSYTIMKCAHESGVKRFVLVSTDKAVRPTNVMGATKRMTELVMHAMAEQSKTIFMAVRFGNVLGSSGSVIPIFRRQIERGGPVTVTHPDVTRYFMTIPEASRLILQAGVLGEGGEIFILEMGTPVKISDMARDLIRLSGKEPDTDIQIEFVGLRPGEKLYEELITGGEDVVPTRHEKIMVLRSENEIDGDWLEREVEALGLLIQEHDSGAIKRRLHKSIPEYSSQESDAVL